MEYSDKGRLEGCTQALAYRIAQHFDGKLRGEGKEPPISSGTLSAYQGTIEKGCDWVGGLTLPSFPSLGSFEFHLPPLPKLAPWTAWGWKKWLEIGDAPPPTDVSGALTPSVGVDPSQPQQASKGSGEWTPFAAGAGLGFAATAVLALGIRYKGRGGTRMQVRRSAEGSSKSKSAPAVVSS